MSNMWQEKGDALVAELLFKDFIDAFAFMTIVAELAEAQNHHPEWSNVYNRVSISLTTNHDGNSITENDRTFASAIEANAELRELITRVC